MLISAKPLGIDQDSGGYDHPENWHGFANGRTAMAVAIKLCVNNQAPRILAPALFCSSALELCGAAQLTYYDCTSHGDVDPDQICHMVATDEFDVLILNHLFGRMPAGRQQIYAACQRHDVIMIDDMCHCPLGSLQQTDDGDDYDVRVFSFRKFLPVPAGGAAQFHRRFQIPAPTGQIVMRASATMRLMIERLVFGLGWRWLWWVATSGHADSGASAPQSVMGAGIQTISLPPAGKLSPALARALGPAARLAKISDRRRAHHAKLAEITAPVGGGFAPDDVPQNFAMLDPSGRLAAMMRAAGVACYNWPAAELPASVRAKAQAFPNAVGVADSILCIPIHQDVTDAQINHIADVLVAYKAEEGAP